MQSMTCFVNDCMDIIFKKRCYFLPQSFGYIIRGLKRIYDFSISHKVPDSNTKYESWRDIYNVKFRVKHDYKLIFILAEGGKCVLFQSR